jgi:hypothetical protein
MRQDHQRVGLLERLADLRVVPNGMEAVLSGTDAPQQT